MNSLLSGLRAWVVQRISAVYMLLALPMVLLVSLQTPSTHEEWLALIRRPLVGGAGGLLVVAVLFHAWVGVRNVVLDYTAARPALRLVLLGAIAAWLLLLGIWTVGIGVKVVAS